MILRFYFYCFAVVLISACNNQGGKNLQNEFSSEMVVFQQFEGNPVFTGTRSETWDKKIRERGFILFEDGQYKMWYTGYNPEMVKEKYLGYATSSDGIHWERYSGNPIFRDKWTEDMFVLRNEGTYYMFAEGENDVAHFLSSPDGLNWQEQGNLVIISSKGDTIPGPYGTPSVWVENGEWYLFYERNDSGIWIATSGDKLTWKNILDEPVIALGPENYDIAAVAANQVVKFKGKYYIYYHATNRLDWQHPSSHVLWSSNVAISTDLIQWTKYHGNPIVEGDHSSPVLVFDGVHPSLYTMHPEVWRYSPQ
jgi:predicted GH43/DUF377 family glycosyl hydrolase